MTLKELFLSSGETEQAFSIYHRGNGYPPMTREAYELYADREIENWFLRWDPKAPDGARIVVILEEE